MVAWEKTFLKPYGVIAFQTSNLQACDNITINGPLFLHGCQENIDPSFPVSWAHSFEHKVVVLPVSKGAYELGISPLNCLCIFPGLELCLVFCLCNQPDYQYLVSYVGQPTGRCTLRCFFYFVWPFGFFSLCTTSNKVGCISEHTSQFNFYSQNLLEYLCFRQLRHSPFPWRLI